MTNQKEEEVLLCAICFMRIRLERAKTNEDGKPVHEECYARKLAEKKPEKLIPPQK